MLPNLNVFRAIAAILVVIFHVPAFSKMAKISFYDGQPIFHRGTQAVIFFFCLSGFLITHLMTKEIKKEGRVKVKWFYARRLLRIYPVYYMVIFLGLILYHVVLPMYAKGIPTQDLTSYNVTTILVYFILMLPNMLPCSVPGIFGILWSIGIEEQFYVIWPHIVNFVKHQLTSASLVLFATYFALCFFTNIGMKYIYANSMWFHLFAIGAYFSTINTGSDFVFIKVMFSKAGQYLLLVLMMLFLFTDTFHYRQVWANHLFQGVFFSYFICAFSVNNNRIFCFRKGLLDYLGKISYGIYMYHAIVLNCVGGIFTLFLSHYITTELSTILFMNLSTITMTILMSGVSYAAYEKMFLKRSRRFGTHTVEEGLEKDTLIGPNYSLGWSVDTAEVHAPSTTVCGGRPQYGYEEVEEPSQTVHE